MAGGTNDAIGKSRGVTKLETEMEKHKAKEPESKDKRSWDESLTNSRSLPQLKRNISIAKGHFFVNRKLLHKHLREREKEGGGVVPEVDAVKNTAQIAFSFL